MTLTFLLLFSLYIGKGYLFTAQGTLDLNELHSVQYNVEILDTPVEDSSVDTKTQVKALIFLQIKIQHFILVCIPLCNNGQQRWAKVQMLPATNSWS